VLADLLFKGQQKETLMRRVLKIALATAAIGFAAATTPAYADPAPTPTPALDPCSSGFVSGALACVGYYGGNLLTGGTGSATTLTEQTYINQLLSGPATNPPPPYPAADGYNPPYTGLTTSTVLGSLPSLNGTATLDFGTLTLSGLTVLGAHFGNNTDTTAQDVTAFWLLNITSPTNTIMLTSGQGSSNAQIFATGTPPVPEPATWGMMLLGFAGMGMVLRRSRRRTSAMMQVA
jgi:hypothetical protein